ncbi:MAG: hypothetical protein HC838_05630 [Spirulinaceae cyanobacterium RM2_2_10]|nr:hypothetical protein [Spirulinaceae cyanobacterium RM2_2_10]
MSDPDDSAELILFDPQPEWVVDAANLRSLSGNTAWRGATLRGRVQRLWLLSS